MMSLLVQLKLQSCAFGFKNKNVFFSINCTITVAINLEAKGEARVHWTETRTRTSGSGRNQRTHHDTVHFNSDELYYRQRFSLLQQGYHFLPSQCHLPAEFKNYTFDFLETGGESFFLPAGNYQYPFSFQLPFGLPSSFEGELGYVRYTIKIVVHRPWKFNYEAKAAIAVNSIYDLNAVSLASVRLHFIETHRTRSLHEN